MCIYFLEISTWDLTVSCTICYNAVVIVFLGIPGSQNINSMGSGSVKQMFILMKKLKSLLIGISVIMIIMASLTSCFGYEDISYKTKNLTVYEQYLKDYTEELDKIYRPEQHFPQKAMQLELVLRFKIQPDGSITDIETSRSSEDLDHEDPTWIIRPIYFWRLKRLSRKHEQYVKELLVSHGAKPFPKEFGDYILVNHLEFRHWNNWLRKPIFENYINRESAYKSEKMNYSNMWARIYRSNYTSGK